MKKIVFFIGVLFVSITNAQDISDALRYADQNIQGTARFRAMGGAFGALGGDLSAIQINPAGSAVFLNSQLSVTLAGAGYGSDIYYGNGINTQTGSNLNFNQLGAVFVYGDASGSSPINKFTLTLAYDQTSDNEFQFTAFGNTSTSIDSYFLNQAQGVPLDLLERRSGESISDLYSFLGETEGYAVQQAYLGYESFILEADDPSDPDNTSYFSNIGSGSFYQEYAYQSTGLNGKFSVNGAAQINNDFYLGLNLNSHFINYDRVTDFFEANTNAGSNINEVLFTNRLSTRGAGFSAQVGAIAKVSDLIRLGFAVESPTWYTIEEETTQDLETFSEVDGVAVVAPDVINIFPEYQLRTPASYTASIAFLFGRQGLISLDYKYKDYTTTKFSSDFGNDYTDLNNSIVSTYKETSTIRLGGEWRNENWSFRGGYVYEESPFKNELLRSDRTGISFGLGYNWGKYKLDFAYDVMQQESFERFYPGSDFFNGAVVDTYRDNLTFTFGINF
ncbi:OmpP1/FadL family transporter [Aquimarina brevivitae]|uniref:Outer membrane protein transport protein (OMPP1/FadL/TodX) n=1 Tax=Aquimarina brevivitae TaxID=323412 RepID=A0A4Q7PJ66_9FLAO|nr:outer membrane protein transport protein [Aquimarina brevivitae]RZT00089.1 outer membrane protein transport protein (OMPP1/FadL/TodX) [Aquimarina brevivitae]